MPKARIRETSAGFRSWHHGDNGKAESKVCGIAGKADVDGIEGLCAPEDETAGA